jgi:hypothetical protein
VSGNSGVHATSFNTESEYDKLKIDEHDYSGHSVMSGALGTSGLQVINGMTRVGLGSHLPAAGCSLSL